MGLSTVRIFEWFEVQHGVINQSQGSGRFVGFFVICDILLTPLGGLETRSISNTTATGFATLALLFFGLALNVASMITLFRKPRIAPTLAIIGSIFFFPAIIADEAGLWSTQPRPIAISYLEIFTGSLLIVVIGLAWMIRVEIATSKPANN